MEPRWGPSVGAVELVWHRANTASDLDSFFDSEVRWVECDARLGRDGVVRARHEPLDGTDDGAWMPLSTWLDIVHANGRAAKIDLKERVLEQTLEATAAIGFDDADLWFNATVEVFRGEEGVRTLTRRHPGARFSSPLDTLAPYLVYAGPAASRILGLLRSWGTTHLSIGACVEDARSVIGFARARGWPINVWDVEDAEDLELALSMGPSSITADLGAIPPGSRWTDRTGVVMDPPAAIQVPHGR